MPGIGAWKQRLPQPGEALPGRATALALRVNRHHVLGTPLQAAFDGMEQVQFGMGCFWGAERKFWTLPGVVATAAGYAGGQTPNPTYREVCSGQTGHAEVVLVAYDPAKLPFATLLQTFWENHDPTQGMRQGNDIGTQYRSAIYCTTQAQYEQALRSRDAFGQRLRGAGLPLRRGRAPAVPVQEPGRLLWPGRDRRELPGGHCGLTACDDAGGAAPPGRARARTEVRGSVGALRPGGMRSATGQCVASELRWNRRQAGRTHTP